DTFKHEYHLKIDHGSGERRPWVSSAFHARDQRSTAALVSETDGGPRFLLLATHKASFGRDRDPNHVVLRFLPRDTREEKQRHDPWSRRISGTHFWLELQRDGLEVLDDSTNGTELEGELLSGDREHSLSNSRLLTSEHAHAGLPLRLAVIRRKAADSICPFEMLLRLYSAAESFDRGHTTDCPGEIYRDVLQASLPLRWRIAEDSRIDALRLRRMGNLPEEQYVLLFRQALIGSSGDAPLCLDDPSIARLHARLVHLDDRFWLEHIATGGTTMVNDHRLGLREIVPLSAGMTLRFGDFAFRFTDFAQLHV
ncbi:MAG: FHA domain-containing protein, partial [Planctomycetaceae bacterium]